MVTRASSGTVTRLMWGLCPPDQSSSPLPACPPFRGPDSVVRVGHVPGRTFLPRIASWSAGAPVSSMYDGEPARESSLREEAPMNPFDVSYLELDSAVRAGRVDALEVAHEVGASAASLGVPLHEVLDRVERAFDGLEPSFAMVRGVAVAWAETSHLLHMEMSCEDPLTQLSTLAHLRSRLDALYRRAVRDDTTVSDSHGLVVVELPRQSTGVLESTLHAVDVSVAMRTAFPGDEVIAQLAPQRFCVVVERDRLDQLTLNLVTVLLRRTFESPPPRVWFEMLPPAVQDVTWVLDALTG